ncbi:MAG: M15 family metallopeptidase, partial [Myxococcales bacterium]|nr:M15 family metallopeptidase [Myxococcales bacterium]
MDVRGRRRGADGRGAGERSAQSDGVSSRDAGATLVDLASVDPTIRVDARYATKDNVLGVRMYPDGRLFALPPVGARLARVQAVLRSEGLSLVVYDAYRPQTVQQRMWERFPDDRYVANPAVGSNHSRGAAVDLTLARADGEMLAMPTPFDDFTRRAHRDFMDLPDGVLANRAR